MRRSIQEALFGPCILVVGLALGGCGSASMIDDGGAPAADLAGGSPDEGTPPSSDGGLALDGASACAPASTIACACVHGTGAQRCSADGVAYASCDCPSYGAELYIAQNGDDSAAGTMAAPFATLERAQTAVRALVAGGLPAGGVVVWMRGGVYSRTASLSLTSADSGSVTAPVVYRGYPGETARIVGGTQLPASAFQPVTSSSPVWSRLDPSAQGQVVAADLKSLGITDYGTLARRGFLNKGVTAALELFIDGQRAPLGRWPDCDRDDVTTPPDPKGTQLTVYGAGLSPDVTGVYVQDTTQDGVSSFTRQGQVGGKTYHLYRARGGTPPSTWVAWFLTTNASGYPAATDPFFFVYRDTLQPMSGAQGATGVATFVPPTAVTKGFENLSTVTVPSTFTFVENRTARWTTAPDAWVHGFFSYTWADEHLPVSALDASTGEITMGGTPYDGIHATLIAGESAVAYVYNLIEEITEPGEWYLDRTSGLLYLWPPANLGQHDLVVSTLSMPLITATGASHVRFEELTLEASRSQLVKIGGSSNDVEVVGCVLHGAGNVGAQVSAATNVFFDGDAIYGTGEDAIALGGGDRPSLTAAKNTVQNCDLHDFGEWAWMYSPAINLSGDGNVVQHNSMHDAPHAAILFDYSSQQQVLYNDIHDVLTFTSDAGAIYSWADWGSYGNIIQHNFIHSLSTRLSGYGVHGIYLDDCASGTTVDGNLFVDIAGSAIFHNGGHDVTMTNNVMVGSASALEAVSYCARNANAVTCTPGSTDFSAQLASLDYQAPPWSTTYPSVATIPNLCATVVASGSVWLTPYGTVFKDNVSFEDQADFEADVPATFASYAEYDHNLTGTDPLFVDRAHGNYNLQPSSPAFALPGFVAIPVDQIGIQH